MKRNLGFEGVGDDKGVINEAIANDPFGDFAKYGNAVTEEQEELDALKKDITEDDNDDAVVFGDDEVITEGKKAEDDKEVTEADDKKDEDDKEVTEEEDSEKGDEKTEETDEEKPEEKTEEKDEDDKEVTESEEEDEEDEEENSCDSKEKNEERVSGIKKELVKLEAVAGKLQGRISKAKVLSESKVAVGDLSDIEKEAEELLLSEEKNAISGAESDLVEIMEDVQEAIKFIDHERADYNTVEKMIQEATDVCEDIFSNFHVVAEAVAGDKEDEKTEETDEEKPVKEEMDKTDEEKPVKEEKEISDEEKPVKEEADSDEKVKEESCGEKHEEADKSVKLEMSPDDLKKFSKLTEEEQTKFIAEMDSEKEVVTTEVDKKVESKKK